MSRAFSNRDDRLCREILQERDLLVGKRPHLLAIDRKGAEQVSIPAQRHKKGARPEKLDRSDAHHVPRPIDLLGRYIRYVDEALPAQHAA
jgi:hypothetical protein